MHFLLYNLEMCDEERGIACLSALHADSSLAAGVICRYSLKQRQNKVPHSNGA